MNELIGRFDALPADIMNARVKKVWPAFVLLAAFAHLPVSAEAGKVSGETIINQSAVKKSVTQTEDRGFIEAHRHSRDTSKQIFFDNNRNRNMVADLQIVSETAKEGLDFDVHAKGRLVVGSYSTLLIEVTVYQKALPKHKFYRIPALSPPYLADETFELLSRVVAYDDWFEGELIEDRYPEGQFA